MLKKEYLICLDLKSVIKVISITDNYNILSEENNGNDNFINTSSKRKDLKNLFLTSLRIKM